MKVLALTVAVFNPFIGTHASPTYPDEETTTNHETPQQTLILKEGDDQQTITSITSNVFKGGIKKVVVLQCVELTNYSLKVIPLVFQLTTLVIEECPGLTDRTLESIAKCPSLTTLRLKRCRQITDRGIEHLGLLHALNSLNLSHTWRLGGRAFLAFSGVPLKELNLTGCYNLEEIAYWYLSNIHSLETLVLDGCSRVEARDLIHLTQLKHLETLSLACCYQLTPTVLLILRALPELRSLNISENHNISIDHLRAFLCIYEGVLIPSLRELNLSLCSQICPNALKRFKENNSACYIIHTLPGKSGQAQQRKPSALATEIL